MKNKVAILGLDGLSIDVLKYGIGHGYLESFGKLSSSIVLKNMDCVPPLTFPSWTSILTGVNPGKHNIFDFFKYRVVENDKWLAELVTSKDLMHPRMHEMIALYGGNIRSFMLNLIPGYPLIPVKNSMILQLDFFVPRKASYPTTLINKFFSEISRHNKIQFYKSNGCEIIRKGQLFLDTYIDIVVKALDYKPDLLWIQIPIPDSILHKCSSALKDLDLLKNVYQRIDKLFNILKNSYDHIFIVSDHGFKLYKKRISINRILYEHGLIVEKKSKEKQMYELDYTRNPHREKHVYISGGLIKILSYKPLRKIARSIYRVTYRILAKLGYNPTIYYESGIDYVNSSAFIPADRATAPPRFYILLNKNNDTINKVKKALKEYGLVVKEPNEIFEGPYTNNAPGLVIIPSNNDERLIVPGTIYSKTIIEVEIASHSRYGIFGLYSTEDELVKAMSRLRDPLPNTILAPIALTLLNYPISSWSDHKDLLNEIIPDYKEQDYVRKWMLYKKIIGIRSNRKT